MEKINFIHIPKCGGTSIRKALDTITTGHLPARKSPKDVDFQFAFIRNPFDRIASLYRHMYERDISKIAQKRWSFEKWFDETVRNSCHNLWTRKYWNPCSWWLDNGEGKFDLDFIGKVENMEEDWQRLCEKLGKNVILEHHNESEKPRTEVYTDSMKEFMYGKYEEDFKIWYPNLIE